MRKTQGIRDKASLRHKERISLMRKPSIVSSGGVSNDKIYRKLKEIEKKEHPSCDVGGYFFLWFMLWLMFK